MGELSSSKREELLNRHRRIQIHGRLKVPFCFRLFCLPILNWKATNNPPLFMPSRGRAKISFFHILKDLKRRATVGSPLVHTFLVPTIFLLGKLLFLSHFGLVYLCFSCLAGKSCCGYIPFVLDGVFHN